MRSTGRPSRCERLVGEILDLPAEACARCQLVEDVDIAIRAGLAAAHGSEDLQPGYPVSLADFGEPISVDIDPGHGHRHQRRAAFVTIVVPPARTVEAMTRRPAKLSPELTKAIAHAREVVAASGGLQRRSGYVSPLGETGAAVARFIEDGTYRRLADAVARDDPEVADL